MGTVAEIRGLSAEERKQIVEGFNRTDEDFPLHLCFHELFEEQVERTPERTALVFGDRRFTYRELNARANQFARHLRAQGLAASTPVGLLLRRSDEMIITLLGILKAGGAYVALHPDLPKARLEQQLSTVKPPLVITQERLVERLPEVSCQVICLEKEQPVIAREPVQNLERRATPTDLIYVIFTSGSTGVPKAVATRHENVVNYTQSIMRKLNLADFDASGGLRMANVSTLSADLGNTPIFAALASGGCLHMVPDDVLLDGKLYGEYAVREKIDLLKIAPSHLRALMATGDPARVLPPKHLVIGGESLHWDFVRQIRNSSPCKILNHYSPTETTIGCLTFETEADSALASVTAVVPLGRPIGNMKVYVLNQDLQPVPVGVPGDLYIGGRGVSNGYLGRPDLTAEKFMPDPLKSKSGLRFYRSGDRARFLPGGIIEFLGREDNQVKVRGFRVELGEVEAVLSRHPAIEQAVVVFKQFSGGDQRLVAFAIVQGKPADSELREFMLRYVPDYMVPSSFMYVDAFPLNANGKADRQVLAERIPAAAPATSGFHGMDAVQEKVAEIWCTVLQRTEVGLDDNFFELGGHSLLATQIIARLRSAFDVPVPLRAIFEAPTVAGLAEVVKQHSAEATEQEDIARILSEVEGLSEEEARSLLEASK
ncbi:MAG TPA: amino acid adenylation domain-containing protein [Terriglobales bacterium]|nr:amino acid adenylation domain-containing protein [Terriglobales bacterium]